MLWERAPPLPRRARTAAGSNGGGLEPRRARTAAGSNRELLRLSRNLLPFNPQSAIRNPQYVKEGRAGAPSNRSPGPSWSRAAGGGGDAKDRWLSSCRAAGAEVCGGHLRRAFGVRRDVGCADRSWGWPPVGQGDHEDTPAASGVPDAERWGEAGGLRRARVAPQPRPILFPCVRCVRVAQGPPTDRSLTGGRRVGRAEFACTPTRGPL